MNTTHRSIITTPLTISETKNKIYIISRTTDIHTYVATLCKVDVFLSIVVGLGFEPNSQHILTTCPYYTSALNGEYSSRCSINQADDIQFYFLTGHILPSERKKAQLTLFLK